MPAITLVYSLLLIGLGLYGYFAFASRSITALIPAFAGLLFAALAALSLRPSLRKHAMHAAAALALLATLGGARGFAGVARMLSGQAIARPAAAWLQTGMSLLSLVFVGLCVRSFILARRTRLAASSEASA